MFTGGPSALLTFSVLLIQTQLAVAVPLHDSSDISNSKRSGGHAAHAGGGGSAAGGNAAWAPSNQGTGSSSDNNGSLLPRPSLISLSVNVTTLVDPANQLSANETYTVSFSRSDFDQPKTCITQDGGIPEPAIAGDVNFNCTPSLPEGMSVMLRAAQPVRPEVDHRQPERTNRNLNLWITQEDTSQYHAIQGNIFDDSAWSCTNGGVPPFQCTADGSNGFSDGAV